jgi:hypothetical protein
MKDEGFEYLMSVLPAGPDKSCALNLLPCALDFIRENEAFHTANLQRLLHTGYSRVIKVIDALLALGIIEIADEKERPIRYVRAVLPEQLDVNVFYNGRVEESGDENKSGWDPSLFKTKEECLAYLKSHYGDDFSGPVYVIETVKVGNGWEVIDCERIGAD